MKHSRCLRPMDFLNPQDYGACRKKRSEEIVTLKKNRRVEVGPDITFYFENYETIQFQIQEMLYIEKGGEVQVQEEIEAYQELIPQGQELIATLMIEVPQPERRRSLLHQLSHIEETTYFSVNQELIRGVPLKDSVERTTPEGKTSSVHFLKFPFLPPQIHSFREASSPILLGLDHPSYQHGAFLSPAVRTSLSQDFL